jgi:L-rhamnose mutarotase
LPVRRYAEVFQIRPELVEDYKKRHDKIWPEMAHALRDSGIRNYSIFYRPDGTLFAYFECDDPAAAFASMRSRSVNAEWQESMDRFFVKREKHAIGPDTEGLREVFHQD